MLCIAPQPRAFFAASLAACRGISRRTALRVATSFERNGDDVCHRQPLHKVTLGDAYLCTNNCVTSRGRRGAKQWPTAAVESESQSEFEIDQDKAREALSKLDQQLESLSKKKVSSPKIRATNLSNTLREQMRDEKPEISGSVLAYTAFALFAFTIFYNILFLTVIKPSIDLPEEVGAASAQRRVADNGELLRPQLLLSQHSSPETLIYEL